MISSQFPDFWGALVSVLMSAMTIAVYSMERIRRSLKPPQDLQIQQQGISMTTVLTTPHSTPSLPLDWSPYRRAARRAAPPDPWSPATWAAASSRRTPGAGGRPSSASVDRTDLLSGPTSTMATTSDLFGCFTPDPLWSPKDHVLKMAFGLPG